jgi:hypothetical protein
VAADVFEYDVAANGWSTQNGLPRRGPMPVGLRAHTAALIGESLFAIGGTNVGGVRLGVYRAALTQLPSANAGGPYTVRAPFLVQLHGSGVDPEGGALTYAWDVGGTLLYGSNGQTTTFLAFGYPVGTVLPARLRVSDPLGRTTWPRRRSR